MCVLVVCVCLAILDSVITADNADRVSADKLLLIMLIELLIDIVRPPMMRAEIMVFHWRSQ